MNVLREKLNPKNPLKPQTLHPGKFPKTSLPRKITSKNNSLQNPGHFASDKLTPENFPQCQSLWLLVMIVNN